VNCLTLSFALTIHFAAIMHVSPIIVGRLAPLRPDYAPKTAHTGEGGGFARAT
jgi:hypothetical protein